MEHQPRVSLIIPVYNDEAYLRACLDSAVSQTLKDLEVICVDDGSTDGSAAILRAYEKADSRLRVIAHGTNRSAAAARKTGVEEARGKYVMFLDADDWLEPDACATAWEAICREGTDVLQFGMAVDAAPHVSEEAVRWFQSFARPRCRRLAGGEILENCFAAREMSWNLVNKIYTAPLIKKAMARSDAAEPMIHGEDLYVTFLALYYAKAFTGISRELYHYRYGCGVTGRAKTTLEDFDKMRSEALVDRRLCRFLEESGEGAALEAAYRGAARALIDDSIGKLQKLPEEDLPEGLRRLVSWWRESPSWDTLARRAGNAFFLCLDEAVPGSGAWRDVVPVVFAIDHAWSPHLAVAVESIRAHADPEREYRLYVLHESISAERARKLEALGADNLSVRCISMENRINRWLASFPALQHTARERYYRFFLPQVFPAYDKLLYLDGDLVAETDVGKLYDTELGDALLAGVENICLPAARERIARDLCVSGRDYINGGVLLFNNRLFREEQVDERCFRFLADVDGSLLKPADRDALNAVCKGRILYLDPAWNLCWDQCCGNPTYVELCRNNVHRTLPMVKILHFASGIKPWTRLDLPLSARYWEYAKRSPMFMDIVAGAAERWRSENPAPAPQPSDTEAALIRQSASYRIGRLITWAPRKLRGLVRCLREHGWGFTWRRAMEHFGIPMGALLPVKTSPTALEDVPAREEPGPEMPAARAPAAPAAVSGPQPLVSVVIPVYNAEPYLPQCLDSLLGQSYKNLEIICVDDGSTDGSARVIEGYAENEPRLRLLRQENQYAGAARNKGMAQSRGEYLLFLDADDFFDPKMAEKLVRQAERTAADVVVCSGWQYWQDKDETRETSWQLRTQYLRGYEVFSRRELPQEIFVFTTPEPWNKLFRRSFAERNGLRFQALPRANDVLFTYSAIACAERIGYVNERLVYNRRGMGTNLQAHNQSTPLAFCEAFTALRRFLEERGWYDELAQSFGNVCLDNVIYNLSTLQGTARETLLHFLREGGDRELNLEPHSQAYFYRWDNFRQYRKLREPEPVTRDEAYYASLPPEKYPEELIFWYGERMKEELSLEHPVTFNEKIQWLKLYDATPIKTRLADKYLARDWVKETIGEEYLIPLLGVWDCFDDIDFDALPDRFVLKANHGSGWNLIVKDKNALDRATAKESFDAWLRKNYAFESVLEMQYLNIPPRILAERYMENADQLYDYKFMCFGGEVKLIWVDTDRFTDHHRTLFTPAWKRMDVTIGDYASAPYEISRPVNLKKMIALAERLSQGFAHVRVDLYEMEGKVYFGEMTFTSTNGMDRAEPRAFEKEMGDWLTLPPKSPIPHRRKESAREFEQTPDRAEKELS